MTHSIRNSRQQVKYGTNHVQYYSETRVSRPLDVLSVSCLMSLLMTVTLDAVMMTTTMRLMMLVMLTVTVAVSGRSVVQRQAAVSTRHVGRMFTVCFHSDLILHETIDKISALFSVQLYTKTAVLILNGFVKF